MCVATDGVVVKVLTSENIRSLTGLKIYTAKAHMLCDPAALLQGQILKVNRPKNNLQNVVYKKGPYSQQCPSARDGGGLLVIHGEESA